MTNPPLRDPVPLPCGFTCSMSGSWLTVTPPERWQANNRPLPFHPYASLHLEDHPAYARLLDAVLAWGKGQGGLKLPMRTTVGRWEHLDGEVLWVSPELHVALLDAAATTEG